MYHKIRKNNRWKTIFLLTDILTSDIIQMFNHLKERRERMKQITIKLDEGTHKAAKIEALKQDKSFMRYVVDLVKKDLATKKEQTQ